MRKVLCLIVALASPLFAQTKTQIVLDTFSQATVWADMTSTEKLLHPQFTHEAGGIIVVTPALHETDPLARPFTALPKPAYYATGTAFALSLVYLSRGMKHSQHGWIRKIWWLPQVAQISLNAAFAAHNAVLLTHR